MPNNLQAIHTQLVKDGYDIPDIDKFKQSMSDTNNVRAIHNQLVKDGYDVPDYETFKTSIVEPVGKFSVQPKKYKQEVQKPLQKKEIIDESHIIKDNSKFGFGGENLVDVTGLGKSVIPSKVQGFGGSSGIPIDNKITNGEEIDKSKVNKNVDNLLRMTNIAWKTPSTMDVVTSKFFGNKTLEEQERFAYNTVILNQFEKNISTLNKEERILLGFKLADSNIPDDAKKQMQRVLDQTEEVTNQDIKDYGLSAWITSDNTFLQDVAVGAKSHLDKSLLFQTIGTLTKPNKMERVNEYVTNQLTGYGMPKKAVTDLIADINGKKIDESTREVRSLGGNIGYMGDIAMTYMMTGGLGELSQSNKLLDGSKVLTESIKKHSTLLRKIENVVAPALANASKFEISNMGVQNRGEGFMTGLAEGLVGNAVTGGLTKALNRAFASKLSETIPGGLALDIVRVSSGALGQVIEEPVGDWAGGASISDLVNDPNYFLDLIQQSLWLSMGGHVGSASKLMMKNQRDLFSKTMDKTVDELGYYGELNDNLKNEIKTTAMDIYDNKRAEVVKTAIDEITNTKESLDGLQKKGQEKIIANTPTGEETVTPLASGSMPINDVKGVEPIMETEEVYRQKVIDELFDVTDKKVLTGGTTGGYYIDDLVRVSDHDPGRKYDNTHLQIGNYNMADFDPSDYKTETLNSIVNDYIKWYHDIGTEMDEFSNKQIISDLKQKYPIDSEWGLINKRKIEIRKQSLDKSQEKTVEPTISTTEGEVGNIKDRIEKLNIYENEGYQADRLRSFKQQLLDNLDKAKIAFDIYDFQKTYYPDDLVIDLNKHPLSHLQLAYYDNGSLNQYVKKQIASIRLNISSAKVYMKSLGNSKIDIKEKNVIDKNIKELESNIRELETKYEEWVKNKSLSTSATNKPTESKINDTQSEGKVRSGIKEGKAPVETIKQEERSKETSAGGMVQETQISKIEKLQKELDDTISTIQERHKKTLGSGLSDQDLTDMVKIGRILINMGYVKTEEFAKQIQKRVGWFYKLTTKDINRIYEAAYGKFEDYQPEHEPMDSKAFTRLMGSEQINNEIKELIFESGQYNVRHQDDVIKRAGQILSELNNTKDAETYIITNPDNLPFDTLVAMDIMLMHHYKNSNDNISSAKVAERIVDRGTLLGQGVSMYRKLLSFDPNFIMMFHMRQRIKMEKLGIKLPPITEEEKNTIQQFQDRIDKAPEGRAKQTAINDFFKWQKRQAIEWNSLLGDLWYAGLLSSPPTQVVNTVGSGLSTSFDTLLNLVRTLRTPTLLGDWLKAVYNGLNQGVYEGEKTFSTGVNPLQEKYRTVSNLEAIRSKDYKFFKQPIKKLLALDAQMMKYVFRAMGTGDLIWNQLAKEQDMFMIARDITLQSKGKLSETVGKIMKNGKEEYKKYRQQAITEGNKSEFDIQRRVYELMDQNRERDLLQESQQEAKHQTYTGKPSGALGAIAESLENSIDKLIEGKSFTVGGKQFGAGRTGKVIGIAVKSQIPFIRITANLVNRSMEYMPTNIVSSILDKNKISSREYKKQMARGIAGTIVMGTVWGLLRANDDEDDPWFDITGKGTGDFNKDYQLKEKGWIPYSVKIGNKYYSYLNTPFMIPFAILGNYQDAIKYRSLDEKDLEKRLTFSLMSGLTAITDQTFIANTSNLFKMVGERNTENVLGMAKSNIARTATSVIPNAIKYIDKQWYDTKIYNANTLTEKILRDVPFQRSKSLNKKYNVLGEEIEYPQTLDKYISNVESKKPWDFIVKKQFFIPSIGVTHTVEGLPMNGKQYSDYTKYYGEAMKALLLNNMDQFTYEPLVEKYGNEIGLKDVSGYYLDEVKQTMTQGARAYADDLLLSDIFKTSLEPYQGASDKEKVKLLYNYSKSMSKTKYDNYKEALLGLGIISEDNVNQVMNKWK